jgi:hypothetical protein
VLACRVSARKAGGSWLPAQINLWWPWYICGGGCWNRQHKFINTHQHKSITYCQVWILKCCRQFLNLYFPIFLNLQFLPIFKTCISAIANTVAVFILIFTYLINNIHIYIHIAFDEIINYYTIVMMHSCFTLQYSMNIYDNMLCSPSTSLLIVKSTALICSQPTICYSTFISHDRCRVG